MADDPVGRLPAPAAVAQIAIAGAVVGIVEGAGVALASDGSAWLACAIVAGCAAAGAMLLAAPALAIVALVARSSVVSAWRRDLGGERRMVAVARAVLLGLTIAGHGFATYLFVRWTHGRFRFLDPSAVGLVAACVITALAVALVAVAVAVDRVVAPRLATPAWAAWVGGRRLGAAGLAAALVTVVAPVLVLRAAAPAVDRDGPLAASVLVVGVIAARVLGLGRRRASRWVAIAAVAGVLVSIASLRAVPVARGLIVTYGTFSKSVARATWRITDRDGDGYPGAWWGGADCDDGDGQRSPAAYELAGNGKDENCTGADLDPALLAERDARRPAAPGPRRNVVLISVDALRPDHLGAWGYRRPTSPVLDAFAATATRFAWALTSCPSTRCAVPALLTGRYAPTLAGSRASGLARVLRDAGWQTAAITCCARFGSGREELAAFEVRDISADAVRMGRAGQSNGDVVADAAIDWLARPHERPFFLWLHLYEPHHPYAAPDGADRFGDRDVDRYDAEIAFADRQIGRVLAALDARGLADTTVVAITADHGDEFNEHGIRFHARSLFNQVVRVPLIVRAPGARPGVVETPVSLVDVMPTLLELAGATGPAGMNGRSLAAAVRGTGAAPERPVLIELRPDHQIQRDMAAVVAGRWKVIWDREANAWSLFSLDDPADAHDRAASEPAALREMQALLRATLDRELGR